jgi:hypothetical protein
VSRARRQARWDDETSGRTDFGLLLGLVGFHLRFAQNAVVDHFLEHVGDGGITPIQFSTLVLVRANPGLTIIDGLEKRGLLERRRPDRRSHALHLTTAGKRLLGKLEPQVCAHDAAIATALSEKEKRLLVDMLDRLAVEPE